jgi:hypothetical protein
MGKGLRSFALPNETHPRSRHPHLGCLAILVGHLYETVLDVPSVLSASR